jgi:hypothetical protein
MRKGDPTTIIEHENHHHRLVGGYTGQVTFWPTFSMVLLREQPTDDDLTLVEGNWVHE